jgi:hypothetical protein
MPKSFLKTQNFLDENVPSRLLLERLNQHFDVEHIRDYIRHGQFDDTDVYQLAVSHGCIVVTLNGSDLRPLVGTLEGTSQESSTSRPAGRLQASIRS